MRQKIIRHSLRGTTFIVITIIIFFSLDSTISKYYNKVQAVSSARTIAVQHMRMMGTTKWVPSVTWYVSAKSDRTDDYIKGLIYKGIPYSQNNGGSTLEQWSHFSSRLKSILYPYSDVYSCAVSAGISYSAPEEFGNDCAKAVFQSWQKAGSSVPVSGVSTASMLSAIKTPSNSMVKVGQYLTNGSDTLYMTDSQSEKDALMKAYSLLQPGDCLFYRYNGSGHAIMVTSVNVSTKQVAFVDQIGSGSATGGKPAGWRLDETKSTWRVSNMTFSNLYASHYVPVTTTFSGW